MPQCWPMDRCTSRATTYAPACRRPLRDRHLAPGLCYCLRYSPTHTNFTLSCLGLEVAIHNLPLHSTQYTHQGLTAPAHSFLARSVATRQAAALTMAIPNLPDSHPMTRSPAPSKHPLAHCLAQTPAYSAQHLRTLHQRLLTHYPSESPTHSLSCTLSCPLHLTDWQRQDLHHGLRVQARRPPRWRHS